MPIMPVLQEEFNRLKDMEKAYIEKIAELPRGSIRLKHIAGKSYPYLVFRDGLRVKTKYIKKEELQELQYKISLRQKYEKALKEIRKDCRLLKRVVDR